MNTTTLLELAQQIGFDHWGTVNREALILRPEVRAMCAADKCRNYNRSWSCPPACGTLEELQERLKGFTEGILVQTTGQMKDAFDLEVIRNAEETHKKKFDILARQAAILDQDIFPMGSGGCRRCRECTYPERPCRFPKKRYPSMEACGLWVSDVCIHSGLQYNYGENTITYTAAILIRPETVLL